MQVGGQRCCGLPTDPVPNQFPDHAIVTIYLPRPAPQKSEKPMKHWIFNKKKIAKPLRRNTLSRAHKECVSTFFVCCPFFLSIFLVFVRLARLPNIFLIFFTPQGARLVHLIHHIIYYCARHNFKFNADGLYVDNQ
jgi:hypothetical protein